MERVRGKIILIALIVMITLIMVDFSILRIDHLSVSGVETSSVIGVYRDSNCKERVELIEWGTLQPGEVKNVTIYVRNEWNESFILFSAPMNWSPIIASEYLYLNFSSLHSRLEGGEVIKINLTLSVSPRVTGVSEFHFNIAFQARKYLGDVDCDGCVGITDLYMMVVAYLRTPRDDKWNPYVDLNNDYIINIFDVMLFAKDFGKT